MKKIFMLLFCISFLASCGSTEILSRQERFLRNNPRLDKAIRTQINKNQISIGMTKEMVRASWGDPYYIEKARTATMVIENWVYDRDLPKDHCCALPEVVHFKNGFVSGWSQRLNSP